MSVEDFKQGLSKFAAMFTDSYGLKLVFRGTQCCTDGKTIIVPELSLLARPNMTDKEIDEAQEFLMTTRGFIYHEGAHVIFSDFKAAGVAHKEGGRKLHTICNMLEDIRIETRIGKVYPGAKEALLHTRAWVNRKIAEHLDTAEDVSPFVQVVYAIGIRSDREKDYEANPLWQKLGDYARGLAVKHEKLILESKYAPHTVRVLEIARLIFDELKDEQKKFEEEQKAKQKEEKKKEKGKKEKKQEEQSSGGDDDEGDADEEVEQSDGEDDDSSPGEDDSDSGEAGSDDDDSSDGDEDQKDEGSGEEKDGDDEGEEGQEKGSGAGAPEDLALDEDDDEDDYTRFEDSIEEEAEKAGAKMAACPDRPYLIYDTSRDYIGPPPEPANPRESVAAREHLHRMTEHVRFAFGPMERTLRAKLQALSHSYHVGGLEDGEVDPALLDRLATRVDDRIFREMVHAKTLKETACCLTIDMSASMTTNNKDVLAQMATLCFAHALDAVKIPFEVLSWSTGHPYDAINTFQSVKLSDRDLFARFGSLLVYVIKSYAEKWQHASTRLHHMEGRITNYDGESIKLSAARLLQRKERRKVMFVLSDGMPGYMHNERPHEHVNYLHQVIKEIRATKKIEVIGIGINSPGTGQFYRPGFVNVARVEELPGVVIGELKKLLLHGSAR